MRSKAELSEEQHGDCGLFLVQAQHSRDDVISVCLLDVPLEKTVEAQPNNY